MVAYQMIYTACGKDKSGAFSVWAKSNEVTKVECDEIVKLMSYRKPKDAPYEPTEEQIKALFPKKYGYFILSSGRKCIAQSSYIGQVYSDLDGRSGNFIIHAYIFDNMDDNCPFGIVNTDIFKSELTYKEWHDDTVPESLPIADIDVKPYFNETEVNQYLNDANKVKVLASITQGVINSLNDSEHVVTFNSSEKEQKTIYSLLGLLLPKKLYEKATFSNQYSTQVEFSLANTGIEPTKIRNIFDGGYSSSFNFDDEIAAGNYAFNFERSLFAEVSLNRYVTDIIHTLKNKTLFETLKKVEQIDKLMQDLQCDVDTAICVYNAIINNFDWFKNVDEFTTTLNLLVNANYIDNIAYAKNVYSLIVKTKRWGFNSDTASVINYVYKNSDETVKDAIIYEVFNSLESFGVSKNQAPKIFVENLKSGLPFAFSDVYKAILRNNNISGLFINSNNPALVYAYFDMVCSILSSQPNTEVSQKLQQELLRIFKKTVASKNFETIKLYLERIKPLGQKAEEWVVYNSIPNLLSAQITNRDDLRFAFEMVLTLSSNETQYKFTENLIKNNLNSVDLIPVYLAVCKNNTRLFEQIEDSMKKVEEYKTFFIKKDAYVFKNTTPITAAALNRYFNDYYLKGYDSGIFLLKFKEYISAIESNQLKLKELFARYDYVAKLENNFGDVVHVIGYIEKEIYSIHMSELLKLHANQINKLGEINTRLQAISPNGTSKKYEILTTVLLLQGKLGKDVLLTAIENNKVYEKLSSQQLEFLVNSYLGLIIEVYVSLKNSNKIDARRAFVSLFYSIVIGINNYKTYFNKALEDVGGREYYDVMADIMAYAFNQSNQFADNLRKFVLGYVDSMKRGQYKKLFKKVEALLDETEYVAVGKYIDKYLDEHKSFFEKLFGKKKEEDDN